jgi:hypothetical protein
MRIGHAINAGDSFGVSGGAATKRISILGSLARNAGMRLRWGGAIRMRLSGIGCEEAIWENTSSLPIAN